MSHSFFEGTVYHKRYTPRVHEFTYPFYLLDIDLSMLHSLKNRLFSYESMNLLSFRSKDHFGQNDDFMKNVDELLEKFGLSSSENMHFFTLPRIVNFVFNPISILVLLENERPAYLFAEVHNYNGGRVVYPVKLQMKSNSVYEGEVMKEMYVSPFLETKGEYRFSFRHEGGKMSLKVDLYEEGAKKLTAAFSGAEKPFKSSTVAMLFVRHSFLTVWIVTRTLWQTFKLWRKGLKWYSPLPSDQIRRY